MINDYHHPLWEYFPNLIEWGAGIYCENGEDHGIAQSEVVAFNSTISASARAFVWTLALEAMGRGFGHGYGSKETHRKKW